MITYSTVVRIDRAWLVSNRYNDSGVVTRMSGGDVAIPRRSSADVSPVLVATWMSGIGPPCEAASRVIPTSGPRKFRSTS
jgi:hypothetical protein